MGFMALGFKGLGFGVSGFGIQCFGLRLKNKKPTAGLSSGSGSDMSFRV